MGEVIVDVTRGVEDPSAVCEDANAAVGEVHDAEALFGAPDAVDEGVAVLGVAGEASVQRAERQLFKGMFGAVGRGVDLAAVG